MLHSKSFESDVQLKNHLNNNYPFSSLADLGWQRTVAPTSDILTLKNAQHTLKIR